MLKYVIWSQLTSFKILIDIWCFTSYLTAFSLTSYILITRCHLLEQ